jgi:hypothetical protein
MGTKSDYELRGVNAARSVLVELMQILGEYRENMVLFERGYRQGAQQYQFFRNVSQDDGTSIEVGIDFLAGEYGGTTRAHRHQDIQSDLKARKARGCELALEHHTKITVSCTMPDGGENSVRRV